MSVQRRIAPPALIVALLWIGCTEQELPSSPTDDNRGNLAAAPSASPESASSPLPAPTSGVTAPRIESPAPGSELTDPRPAFVIANSSTSEPTPVTYSFQVASDPDFESIVAERSDVPQGDGGRTSWQVPEPLSPGDYVWRARGEAGLVKSPYATADFTVVEPAPPAAPDPPPGEILLFDPLIGGSIGTVHGGAFVAEGWRVTARSDYIRYEIPPLENGYVQWDARGLARTNPSPDQFMLFGMWDPSQGPYRENPYRVHLQKLDTNHNRPYVRLRWIAGGEQHDEGANYLDWNPDQVYRWRVEWGRGSGSYFARVYVDGQLGIEVRATKPYLPRTHWVELGIAERSESIVGVIYSNVAIGARETATN